MHARTHAHSLKPETGEFSLLRVHDFGKLRGKKERFSGILRCESSEFFFFFFPIVLLWLFEAGVHIAAAYKSRVILLNMWDVT